MPTSRAVLVLALLVIGLGPTAAPLMAQGGDTTPPLELSRTWGGMRWSHEGAERQNLFGGWGFGLNEDLVSILERHPEAAETVNSAKPWYVVQTVGIVGILVLSILDLVDSFEQLDALDEGRIQGDGGPGVLDYVIVGGVTLTGHFVGNSRVKKGFRIFNEAEGFTAGEMSAAPGFSVDLTSPVIFREGERPGLGLGFLVRP